MSLLDDDNRNRSNGWILTSIVPAAVIIRASAPTSLLCGKLVIHLSYGATAFGASCRGGAQVVTAVDAVAFQLQPAAAKPFPEREHNQARKRESDQCPRPACSWPGGNGFDVIDVHVVQGDDEAIIGLNAHMQLAKYTDGIWLIRNPVGLVANQSLLESGD